MMHFYFWVSCWEIRQTPDLISYLHNAFLFANGALEGKMQVIYKEMTPDEVMSKVA